MIIELSNVSITYKDSDKKALDNINLKIKKGEMVFLTGQSGAGKSTLVKLLFRELLPDSGQIFVNNHSINRLDRKGSIQLRRNIGVVFQDFRLMDRKTIFENVAFVMKAVEKPWDEIKSTVPKVLDSVGLAGKENLFPQQLSGGEQQRVALARAIVNDPMIILADEPTGNLDPDTSDDLMELMLKINEQGTTIVMATHDKRIVNDLQKRVVALKNGKLIGDAVGGWLL